MKFVKIAAGVIVAIILVIVVVLMTVDVSQYKGVIQDQVKAATGRDVTIGDIKLSLSLTPSIVVSDVKVANAPWGSQPVMISLKSLEAHTQLIPLLFGTVHISGLKLVEPDLTLETDAKGKGNWEFDTPKAATPASGGGSSNALSVSGITVEGLKLAYRDGKTKATGTAAAKNAEVDIEGPLADLNIPSIAVTDVSGSYSQGAMTGQGSAAKLSLNAVGSLLDLNLTKLAASDLKGAFKDGPTSYEGEVNSLAIEGVARKVSGKQASLDPFAALKSLNVTSLAIEKASATMKTGRDTTTAVVGKIALESKGPVGDLGIANIAVSDSKLTMSGEGAPVEAEISNLALDGTGKLVLTAKVGGQDLKANGTLAPIAMLAKMDRGFPAKIEFDGMGLKGTTDITVTVSQKRGTVKGAITIPELDLSAFAKASGAGTSGTSSSAGGSGTAPASQRLFSDEPLPWDTLAAGDANVTISIGKLTLPSGLVLTKVVLPVNLASGKLALTAATFNVAGGTVTSTFTMNAADKSVTVQAEAAGITAETVAKEMKKGDLITQGPLDVALDVHGTGNTAHAIAASMNGSFIAGMGESRIRSGALNIIGADIIMQVLGALNPIGNKDPYTVSRCGVVNLQIANGVGTTKNGIALVTDKMQLTSSGTVNFGTERVDLSFSPKATGGLGVGLGALAQAVRVSGPLSAPGVGIDKGGAVKTLSTLGAAFATGGLSAVVQGAKGRVTGGGDPCEAARTWHLKK